MTEMKAFEDWKKGCRAGTARPPLLKLPNNQLVGADWFASLQKRKGWLSEEISILICYYLIFKLNIHSELYVIKPQHLDALLCLMLYKYNRDATSEAKLKMDWTIIEHWATDALGKVDFARALRLLLPYVNEKRPYIDGIEWTRVNRVLGLGNINKEHWVAYEINFDEQCITVYDSLIWSW